MEALRHGRQVSFRQVEFHPFHAVHGEENHSRREGLALLDYGGEIVKRREFDAADAQALRPQRQNHPPEFVFGVAEGNHHQRSRHKGTWRRTLARICQVFHELMLSRTMLTRIMLTRVMIVAAPAKVCNRNCAPRGHLGERPGSSWPWPSWLKANRSRKKDGVIEMG